MDYGGVIYDQPLNESLSNKIESVQYKAALAITGAIQGSSQKKLFQELGLEHLHQSGGWDDYVYFIRFFIAKFLNISIALFYPWELQQDYQIHLLISIVGPSIFKTLFYLMS